MDMTIRLQVFEGPLDLLLYLIDRNKVNIYDIPIVDITNQYMEYLADMQKSNLDVLSEFLVMAATLVEIKCRMLLPRDPEEEEEEDPRADLVKQLIEYKMYKHMAVELKDRNIEASRQLYKSASIPEEVRRYQPPVDLDELCKGLDIRKLNEIFRQVMRRREDKLDPVRSRFGKIQKEEVSLDEKMVYMKDYAARHKHFSFRGLLEKQSSRVNIIVTFLAILELMKNGSITIVQENLFDDIQIESLIAEEEE